jgi:hypothetical protein
MEATAITNVIVVSPLNLKNPRTVQVDSARTSFTVIVSVLIEPFARDKRNNNSSITTSSSTNVIFPFQATSRTLYRLLVRYNTDHVGRVRPLHGTYGTYRAPRALLYRTVIVNGRATDGRAVCHLRSSRPNNLTWCGSRTAHLRLASTRSAHAGRRR